jgi:hypothetical protein
MLCDISVVFNSFADAFGLMSRKLSSEGRQVLVRFQSSESFGRLQYAGGGPLLREYLVDPQRVYIDGLSAGAAVAAIMGATYFGLFAAIGVHPGPRDVHFFEFGATNRYSSGRPRQGTNYDVENDRSRPTSSFL